MEENVKYYTSYKGKKTPLKDVETTHLINGLAKRYRELFSAENEDDFNSRINEINDIKEETYSRINKFHDEKIKKEK